MPRQTLVVAELSSSHSGKYPRAVEMIKAAAWAGCGGVKMQTFDPDMMASATEDNIIQDGPWSGWNLHDLYEKGHTPPEWLPSLAHLARSLGMKFGVSVYYPSGIPAALSCDPDFLKIASFEIGYTDLIKAVAETGRPTIVSTGTATFDEIQAVVDEYKDRKNGLILLKCTSQYPAPLSSMNLLTIPDARERFQVPVGLSDHTTTIVCPVVAVSYGAVLIEKHLKLDDDCLDAAFSITPEQFKTMVTTIRAAEQAIGVISYEPSSTRFKRKEIDGKWLRTAN